MNIIPSMASLTMIIITVLPLLSGYQVAIRASTPSLNPPRPSTLGRQLQPHQGPHD